MRIDGKPLMGSQRKALREALNKAFNERSLDQMLRESLEPGLQRKLTDITNPRYIDFLDVLNDVLDRADEESWTAQLLQAALHARPNDADLHNFAIKFTPVVDTKHLLAMERTIRANNPSYDINLLVKNLVQFSNCVCHIENYAGEHLGTGFLVKPNVVMTNYHVWKEACTWDNFFCRFDFMGIPNSGDINEGIVYGLVPDECILYKSEPHPEEFSEEGKNVTPLPNQLDFVFLQLKGSPGDEFIGHDDPDYRSKRGWLQLSPWEHRFSRNDPLFIIHHPTPQQGMPYFPYHVMRISIETDAILDLNQNGTRVSYRTNTNPGSSGAPCFNANWEPVAIHQAGEAGPKDPQQSEYNQGIPFSQILRLLKENGQEHLLDIAQPKWPGKNIANSKKPSTSVMHDEDKGAHPSSNILSQETGLAAVLTDQSATDHTQQAPIDITKYQEKQDRAIIMNQAQLLQEARQLVDEAQKQLHAASTPFTEDTYTTRQYRSVLRALEKAEASLQSLDEVLHLTSFLPAVVKENYISIKDRIDSFKKLRTQIVSSLNWSDKGDFSGLYAALYDIEKLIFK